MATPTYKQVANIKLTSTAASVLFSSITQEYSDLIVVFNGALSTGTSDLYITYNDAVNYSVDSVRLTHVDGGAAGGGTTSRTRDQTFNTITSILGDNMITFNVLDYSSTDKYKSIFYHHGRNATGHAMAFTTFNSLTPITSIEFQPVTVGRLFSIGSSFSIYGIVK